MNGLSGKLRRPAMTPQTVSIGIGAFVLNRLFPRSCHVAPPMSHTVQLGFEGTVYPIGGMTGVALVVRDPFVGVVFSRQRGALRILQVVHKRRHGMTGSARMYGLGLLKEERGRVEKREPRQQEQANEQHQVISAP